MSRTMASQAQHLVRGAAEAADMQDAKAHFMAGARFASVVRLPDGGRAVLIGSEVLQVFPASRAEWLAEALRNPAPLTGGDAS